MSDSPCCVGPTPPILSLGSAFKVNYTPVRRSNTSGVAAVSALNSLHMAPRTGARGHREFVSGTPVPRTTWLRRDHHGRLAFRRNPADYQALSSLRLGRANERQVLYRLRISSKLTAPSAVLHVAPTVLSSRRPQCTISYTSRRGLQRRLVLAWSASPWAATALRNCS